MACVHVPFRSALFLLLVSACVTQRQQREQEQPSSPKTRRPVIGILSSPLKLPGADGYEGMSWVWGTYVDALHALGAHVVPLDMSCPLPVLREKLAKVDAALLTGGSDDAGVHGVKYPDKMMDHIREIFEKAIHHDPISATGKFPLWATCQGFQAVCVLAAGDPSVIVPTYGTEFAELPLHLTATARDSGLLRDAPEAILQELTGQQATLNFHSFGVLAEAFAAGSRPHVQGFNLIATDRDMRGQTFAAMMEHERLPIFGTQFHPEMYHWLDNGHTRLQQKVNAANMYLMRRFVEHANATKRTMTPWTYQHTVKWYPRVELPISVLGVGFERRFPKRVLHGYVFDAGEPMGPFELEAKLSKLAQRRQNESHSLGISSGRSTMTREATVGGIEAIATAAAISQVQSSSAVVMVIVGAMGVMAAMALSLIRFSRRGAALALHEKLLVV
mmetsp:Transcript_33375/g.92154  ORF Transcript_33375/g.92154 Transcript_33375/m.92154 type:complete len:446 (-) Transcript_33375:231-1568(-)